MYIMHNSNKKKGILHINNFYWQYKLFNAPKYYQHKHKKN